MLPVDKKPSEIFVNYDLVNRNLQRTAFIQYKMQNKAFFKERCPKILPNYKKSKLSTIVRILWIHP